jgi:23S rRNA (pseudouridine1915-N3)-methyltransferase
MKLRVLAVGRPGRLLAAAIAEYEARVARYWGFDVVEVKEERGGARADAARIAAAESRRLLERVPAGYLRIALTREGASWSSTRLAAFLQEQAVRGTVGAAFLIGGAVGLAPDAVAVCEKRLSLSAFTLPHELARLVLAEQLYRAGTIARGEPYHKGTD